MTDSTLPNEGFFSDTFSAWWDELSETLSSCIDFSDKFSTITDLTERFSSLIDAVLLRGGVLVGSSSGLFSASGVFAAV